MSILDDILKMVDNSAEFTDAEKRALKADCKESYDMEMASAD